MDKLYLQAQPVMVTSFTGRCSLPTVGLKTRTEIKRLSLPMARKSSFNSSKVFTWAMSFIPALAAGSGETYAAKQRQPDKPEAERSGAWVRKVRARRQGVTLYTDSLTDLRAEHVSDSGPNAKRPTDRGLCGRLGHEYHRGTLPCSLPPSQGLSRRKVRYSTMSQSRFKQYMEYLESEHWKQLRQQKFKQIGKRKCCVCLDGGNQLHVHHIRYKDFIDCTIDDLAVLCQECHYYLHAALKVRQQDPDSYDSPEAIAGVIHWYKTTPQGELDRAHRAARRANKLERRRKQRSWKDCCRALINTGKHDGYNPASIRAMVVAAQELLARYDAGEFKTQQLPKWKKAA